MLSKTISSLFAPQNSRHQANPLSVIINLQVKTKVKLKRQGIKLTLVKRMDNLNRLFPNHPSRSREMSLSDLSKVISKCLTSAITSKTQGLTKWSNLCLRLNRFTNGLGKIRTSMPQAKTIINQFKSPRRNVELFLTFTLSSSFQTMK